MPSSVELQMRRGHFPNTSAPHNGKHADGLTGTRMGLMDAETSGCELSTLRPGDHLQAWEDGMLCHAGVVEEVAPALGVVWIREPGLGARKMLSVDQHQLRTEVP